MNPTRPILLGLLALVTTGCDRRHHLDKPLAAYLDAVEALVDAADDGPTLPDGLPRRRDRRIDIEPPPTINVRGFVAVQGCGLGEVIGHRNSALGRVMTHSQHLLYDLRFLRIATKCMPALEPDMKAKLDTVIEHKTRSLNQRVYNAVWAGAEIGALMSISKASFEPVGALRSAAEVDAVTALIGPLRQRESPGGLEERLSALRSRQAGGAALRQIEGYRYTLAAIAERLDRVTPDAAWCEPRREGLQAAFDRHYLGIVQPMAVRDDQALRGLLTAIDQLYRATTEGISPPPVLAEYHRRFIALDGESLWARYRVALRDHARAWNRIFSACAMRGVQQASD